MRRLLSMLALAICAGPAAAQYYPPTRPPIITENGFPVAPPGVPSYYSAPQVFCPTCGQPAAVYFGPPRDGPAMPPATPSASRYYIDADAGDEGLEVCFRDRRFRLAGSLSFDVGGRRFRPFGYAPQFGGGGYYAPPSFGGFGYAPQGFSPYGYAPQFGGFGGNGFSNGFGHR